jgi:hypothetical protein
MRLLLIGLIRRGSYNSSPAVGAFALQWRGCTVGMSPCLNAFSLHQNCLFTTDRSLALVLIWVPLLILFYSTHASGL